jgi:alpha-tubulin suppressor-like RCC1 family protein
VLACVAPLDRVADATDCDDTSRSVGAARLYFADTDGDSWGDPARATLSCAPVADRIVRGGDCDDTRAAVRPMGTEVCGGGDEDCDGEIDEDPSASAGCTVPGATGACVAGACTIAMCTAGAGDCNGDRSDGCETNLSTTATSCGMCGRSCGAGERCRDGECARIVGVAAGRSHLCALLGTGRVSCWGDNGQGQLGRAIVGGQYGPARDASEYVQIFTGATLEGAVAIAASPRADFTCAVLATGQVACWGYNDLSQCGGNATVLQVSRAVYVPDLGDAVAIDLGASHACAIRATGGVVCWGSNAQNQLGLGTPAMGATHPARSGTPRPMVELEGGVERPITDAAQVVANDYFTCVLHMGGTRVSCAGQNGSGAGWGGQLGRPGLPNANYRTADDVALPSGTVVSRLVGGSGRLYDGFTCALRSAGPPLCWGMNDSGQLGPFASIGGGTATPTPIEPLLFADTRDVYVGPGRLCVSYLNASFGPRVGCLGDSTGGELALGALSSTSVVFDMRTTADTGPEAFVREEMRELHMGGTFSCALLTSGALSCFGNDLASAHGGSRRVADFSVTVANVP